MVAYTFQPQFLAPIQSGAMTLTLRPAGRKVHAAAGGRIGLDFPRGRGHAVRRISALCELRASVVITASGLLRVLETASFNAYGAGLERLLQACEQGGPQVASHLPQLAALAGFADWDALWAWQLANRTPDEIAGANLADSLRRQIIGWNPATLEQWS